MLLSGLPAVAELLLGEGDGSAWRAFEDEVRSEPPGERISSLVKRFGLSSFELKCIMVGLGQHVQPTMAAVLERSGGSVFSRAVTVRLLIDRFCEGTDETLRARRSFFRSAPLLRHRLASLGQPEAGSSAGLMARRLVVTAPTIRYLLWEEELSENVERIAQLTDPEVDLLNVIIDRDQREQLREMVENHDKYRQAIGDWGFDKILPYGRGLTLLFSGPSGTGKTLLAHALAGHIGRSLLSVSASDLPESEGLEAVLSDLFTEATMRDAVVVIDECEALLGKGDKRKATAFRAMEDFEGILVLTTNHPERLDDALERRIIVNLPFEIPDAELRRHIWEVHLPPGVPLAEDVDLEALANTYDFSGGTIKNAILVAVNRARARDKPVSMGLLEEGCTSQLRYALEDLTVRTTTHLRLKDIVLPDAAKKKVQEILAAVRNQSTVLNRWGFGRKLVTGKGITVLFDGPPGTGKTLCAEIIAGEFNRALYRVNIPEVVSKWVGETEKHIKAIFQQARISHAMLLFDEADSLFSARTAETQTATDRYANMEVNLLLQEIERFPGICILTTNFYGSLDRALIRRIQFRVTFEEPTVEQRALIWETLCPSEAPCATDVDFMALAKKYDLTGGMIKNALLRAAYMAADRDSALTQAILHEACRDEYVAAGKVTRDASAVVEKRARVHRGLAEEDEPGGPAAAAGAPSAATAAAGPTRRSYYDELPPGGEAPDDDGAALGG
ncbi:MAG: AAA family ATPase [Deltaproteobacteria bacterium]|nr:AAA family ATPase [Deltaproteobacteria bacterium]MCB9788426.1 AAA family ATPase [Deltaproteobacteria bacterium]